MIAGPVITGDMPLAELGDDFGAGFGPVPGCCEDCDEWLDLEAMEADLGPEPATQVAREQALA